MRFFEIVDNILNYHPNADIHLLEKAYVFAAKVHRAKLATEGEAYLDRPLGIAGILAHMRLDEKSIAAGLLHDVIEESGVTPEALAEDFGNEVATVVQETLKLGRLRFSSHKERQAEYVRKMLFAVSQDVRVVLVKLAERLRRARELGSCSGEEANPIAEEILEIYAPLADRLGIEWMRMELEDNAFRCLHTKTYEEIVQGLAKTEEERRRYITEVVALLREKLEEHGLEVLDITGRSKRPYSIYKKMTAQRQGLEHIHDLTAFRVILKNDKDCYEALALAHALWEPVAGRFKDYISKPKANGYKSLHTTVIGPNQERMEIQIRTDMMDLAASEGIASHWLYKEGKYLGASDEGESERFSWLREILGLPKDFSDPKEFLDALKVDLYPDEVYVFTPQGDIRMLPKGATPVDFAFEIHTEVGRHCAGAKVNGKLVPLRQELQNGDVIEIVTSANQRPSKDWMKFVKTVKARERIRRWVKLEERERSIALGKEICEREFRKKGLNFNHYINSPELQEAAESLSLRSVDDLLASIGYRKTSPSHVIGKLSPAPEPEEPKKIAPLLEKRKQSGSGSSAIRVRGADDVLVRIARCCNPVHGEPIVGYITRGRGVTVHHVSCHNLEKGSAERQIDVQWDATDGGLHAADLQVVCVSGRENLTTMSALVSQMDANIVGLHLDAGADGLSVCRLRIEVKDGEHLRKVVAALRSEKSVCSVQRRGVE